MSEDKVIDQSNDASNHEGDDSSENATNLLKEETKQEENDKEEENKKEEENDNEEENKVEDENKNVEEEDNLNDKVAENDQRLSTTIDEPKMNDNLLENTTGDDLNDSIQIQLEKELQESHEQKCRERDAKNVELSKFLYGSRVSIKNRKKLKSDIFLSQSRLELTIWRVVQPMVPPTPLSPQEDAIFDHPEDFEDDQKTPTSIETPFGTMGSPLTSPTHRLKSKKELEQEIYQNEFMDDECMTVCEKIPFRRVFSIKDDTNRTKQYYGFTVSYLPEKSSVMKQLVCQVSNNVIISRWIKHLKTELYGTSGKLMKYNNVNQRHALVIANPVSGKRDGMFLFKKYARPLLDASDITYDIVLTEYEKHATTITKETKIVGEYQVILIAGGDGTLHEALQGLFNNKYHNYTDILQIPIGVIPIGTSNAVATDVGIPHPDGNAESIAESAFVIARGRYLNADVASCLKDNKRYFSLMMTSWGIVADVETRSQWLRNLGSLRVTLAALFFVLKNKYAEASLTFVSSDAFDDAAKSAILNPPKLGNAFTKHTNHVMYPPAHPPVPYLLKYFEDELKEIVPSLLPQLESEFKTYKRELVFASMNDEGYKEFSEDDLSRMVLSIERTMKQYKQHELKVKEQELAKSPSYRFAALLSPSLVRKQSPRILSIESDEDSWNSDEDLSSLTPLLTPNSTLTDKRDPDSIIYEDSVSRQTIDDSFFNITVSNIPHLAQNFYADPFASPSSGLLHLYYINKKSGASDKVKLMKGMTNGSHIHNPRSSFAATKAVLIRPKPSKNASTLIDGEEFSDSPVLIEVHPFIAKLLASENHIDPYHLQY
mmetsp:Transcript_2018/g.2896  ORF Transcript_2018/g.2896 Transcript_2018/m.2896 type:complete len:829 (+) Transcript_2018:32-2518(+)